MRFNGVTCVNKVNKGLNQEKRGAGQIPTQGDSVNAHAQSKVRTA